MNLAAAVLQMAMSIVSMVQGSPYLPQWQRDQALSIANQAVQFANQTLQQGGYQNCQYPYNNYNCSGYNTGYQNCQYPYNNYNCSGYQNPSTGVQLFILDGGNNNAWSVHNGQSYTVMWTPFNTSQGSAALQLYNSTTGSNTFLASVYGNSTTWIVSASTGNYQLQVVQNGSIIASRSITVQ